LKNNFLQKIIIIIRIRLYIIDTILIVYRRTQSTSQCSDASNNNSKVLFWLGRSQCSEASNNNLNAAAAVTTTTASGSTAAALDFHCDAQGETTDWVSEEGWYCKLLEKTMHRRKRRIGSARKGGARNYYGKTVCIARRSDLPTYMIQENDQNNHVCLIIIIIMPVL
jgi:hypothetical protein